MSLRARGRWDLPTTASRCSKTTVMRAALLAAAGLGVPVSQHAEDTRLTGGCSMNAGPVAFRLGLRGMTVEAESRIVERDIRLAARDRKDRGIAAASACAACVDGAALACDSRGEGGGLHVTCEAAPHHFTLTEEAVGDYDTQCEDESSVACGGGSDGRWWQALLDGTVDCIATDHAPHAAHEKEVEFERAPNGITGLETALGLAMRVLHREHGMALSRIVELMSAQPATLIGLQDRGTSAGGELRGCGGVRCGGGVEFCSEGIAFEVEEYAV